MKMIIKIIAFLLLAVIIVICCFGVNLYAKTHRDKSTAGKEATTFTTDGSRGTRITNIPFDDYITPSEADKNAVIPDIGESLSGEENSAAINSAVKSLPSGSTIYIPPGEYKVSTIVLKSNMTLFISSGAKLVSLSYDENAGSKSPLNKSVIYALGTENITITGGGAICGSGESYTDSAEAEEPLYALNKFNMYTRVIESRRRIRMAKEGAQRSNIILLEECTNSVIENIVLEESAEWTCVLRNCRGATIKNIIIDNNLHVANSDGIDIVNSSNISISSCFIATGDDAVVLKSPEGEISNVTVENCVLSSFANCFKIGTETRFDVNNVTVKDCMFFMPDGITGGYAGIAVESADGGNVSKITVENIEMDGISAPFLIWLGDRLNYGGETVGGVSEISLCNINARNIEMPSAITGCKSKGDIYRVKNITLQNINATYRNTGEALSIRKNVDDISMSGYPEITRVSHIYFISHKLSGYWDLPCYSLFVRYGDNIDYTGVKTTPRSCNERNEFYLRDNI